MNSKAIQNLLCVVCKSFINTDAVYAEAITCPRCSQSYPVVNGIPVMINESESIFTFGDFIGQKNLFFDITKKGGLISRIAKIVPSIGGNNLGKRNFTILENLLRSQRDTSKVLVVGGSILGDGMTDFVNCKFLEITEGDVSFGPRTKIIFDAHSIPYRDGAFECVIVQAVLEHVIDSRRCVAEIYRVLKPGGIVYAETPFMQQVHGGPYDFTRYTHSGHRKLFASFEEIKSGPTAGSATGLAWAYQYFLLALFGHTKSLRLAVKIFARVTGFWIKYLDFLTSLNKFDYDGASGFYFFGRKSEVTLKDQDLISYYFRK